MTIRKLYVYDHCPFCLRARMPFGLKDIPVELRFLANDDEETPISMVGRKMLPILEDEDGHTGESLDIVAKLDGIEGPRLFDGPARQEITDWIDAWQSRINSLVIPRTPVAIFPEFRTPEARAYFTAKKEEQFGRFDDLLARTDEISVEVAQGLRELEPILPDPDAPSLDDILLFPILRGLSILPDLPLPPKVEAYRDEMASRSRIPLIHQLESKMVSDGITI
jgi:glutaredoxin 2